MSACMHIAGVTCDNCRNVGEFRWPYVTPDPVLPFTIQSNGTEVVALLRQILSVLQDIQAHQRNKP